MKKGETKVFYISNLMYSEVSPIDQSKIDSKRETIFINY